MLKLSIDQIIALFENEQFDEITKKINLLHPGDAAQIINELPAEFQVQAF